MGPTATPTRENRTITVDFRDDATYFRLLKDGKAFVECVLAFLLALGFQLKHKATCDGGGCLTPYSQNIRTPFPSRCYAPTIARTWACLSPHYDGYSPPMWTIKATGERRWIGRPYWHTSQGLSISMYCYETSIWSRRIACGITRSRGAYDSAIVSAQPSPRSARSSGRRLWRKWPQSSSPTRFLLGTASSWPRSLMAPSTATLQGVP